MGVADDTWHHVCLSWLAERGSLAIFKDGERKYQSDGFWSSSRHLGIQGDSKTNIIQLIFFHLEACFFLF